MFDKLDDTIVAISTPQGSAQRGVVRLSGPAALDVASQMFSATSNRPLRSHTSNVRVCGRVALRDGMFILPAELFIFRAPRSYTREEVVEFHAVGAAAVLSLILDRAVALGARQAEGGEFTARAFFHGALDLPEVEGVAALIQARSDEQLRAAHEWLDGHLAAAIRAVQQALVELVSLVEADIDFADEPIDFIRPDVLGAQVAQMVEALSDLLRHSESAERVDHLPRVLLVGPPNAGKSTLMNRLSGMKRAVCSPIPGTTRDVLTAVVRLPHGEIELLDSAGIGKKPHKLENFSKNFLDREIRHVQVLCHLLDLTQLPLDEQVLPEALLRRGALMWVANKTDLVADGAIRRATTSFKQAHKQRLLAISAETGSGVVGLRKTLDQMLFRSNHHVAGHGLAINARHRATLGRALEALRRAQQWCERNEDMIDCAEWVAADLRGALNELGAIFGAVTTDELLNHIFGRFCIGK